MKRQQMEAVVVKWQDRLGLNYWEIEVDWEKDAGEDADATTWRSNSYERATVGFSSEYEKWDLFFANQVVVHELLHLLTRDIDEVVKDACDQIHRDASTQIDRRYEHEIEGFVDRHARRLVTLLGCVGGEAVWGST